MIRPPGFSGAAFGTATEGDLRVQSAARRAVAGELGVSPEWAYLTQIHGARVVAATAPGMLGEGDALFTTRAALPLAVATADCVPIILEGPGFAAVVHAGWRGASSGVLEATLNALETEGLAPERAAIGPSIGPCCYEVGPEVAERFPGYMGHTTWGTTSVDLAGYLEDTLRDVPTWRSSRCTRTDNSLNSFRRNRTRKRQVAVAWLLNV